MTNELIKITEKEGKRTVSARELYDVLQITERFNSWFSRMLKYGFENNIDYVEDNNLLDDLLTVAKSL